MKKPFTFLVLFLSLILLVSCSHTTFLYNEEKDTEITSKKSIPETFIPQDVSIVSVGDSLTQGVGDSTGRGGYVPYLKDLLENTSEISNAVFYNYGVRGNRSDQLLKKIKTEEVLNSFTTANSIIITIGGNDIMKVVRNNISNLQMDSFNKQLEEYKANLMEVLQIIREKNAEASIILVGVYNPFLKVFSDIREMNEIVDNWNQTSKDVLSQYQNTYFVSISDIFENPTQELLYTDYFHPNDQGYELIANELFETMDSGVIETMVKEKNAKQE
ncbi:SGNH/GDSL hydrolase family protein [Bacillus sp. B1-b2]|uniref:SGNH/GDSL hydrolase family protein n=1 Tax=Bacillus sp. B1-b2 TaxID=2653201 RepID=UPI0012619B70|nr:SGNH/GDSL hydrolase family protein [Bacillus sp. B1-b2]KAB7673026.1 SGNH/GDSL hydrolase family protein [Bacillus sp. B1-b2]